MVDEIIKTNPYPGFRAFNSEENEVFFGREKQVGELISKLRTNRLLAVVGTSGSGKTSLVRCGLLPRLKDGFSARAGDDWRIAMFRPDHDPIGNMSAALAGKKVLHNEDRVEPNFQSTIEATLRGGSLGLAEVYQKSVIRDNANLLLVVDSFEEIFDFNRKEKKEGGSTNDSLTFINLLLYAHRQRDMPIYIVFTMRSDYLGEAAEFRGLPEVINEGQYLIPRMKRQELRRAIIGPLTRESVAISPILVNNLLDEIPEGYDELPILQHTLMRLWDQWSILGIDTLPIDENHYSDIGTMKSALKRHAEEAYEELSDGDKVLCERIFKLLVGKGRSGLQTRRPTMLKDIVSLTGASTSDILHVVNTFSRPGRSFLDAPPIDDIEAESYVNISHGSLIRSWDRLSGWVEEEAASVETYLRLSDAAGLYYSDTAGLWRNPELQIGLKWRETTQPTKLWANRYNDYFTESINFLDASKKAYEDQLAFEEAERQDKLKKANRRAKIAILAGLLGLLLAIVASFSMVKAIVKEDEAKESKIVAENEGRRAYIAAEEAKVSEKKAVEKEQIANEALYQAEISAEKARAAEIIAVKEAEIAEAERVKAEQEKRNAEGARKKAEEAKKKAEMAKRKAEEAKKKEAEERKKAEESRRKAEIAEKEAKKLRVLGIAQSIAIKSTSLESVNTKALLAKEAYEVNRIYKGNKYDPYIYSGLHKAVQGLYGDDYNRISLDHAHHHRGAIRGVASSSGGHLFTQGGDGRLLLWNTIKPDNPPVTINKMSNSNYRTLALSKNSKLLVCGGNMPAFEVYDLENSGYSWVIPGHNRGGSNDIAIRPDSKGFYSAGENGNILYANLNGPGDSAKVVVTNSSPVKALSVSPRNEMLAAGDKNGNIKIYKPAGSSVVYKTLAIGREITSLQFSPDGKSLAIGNVKGSLKIWNWSSGKQIDHEGHTSRISKISYNSSGTKLLTSSYDGDVRVWLLKEFRGPSYLPIVLDHGTWVTSAAFNLSGNSANEQIITGTKNGELRIWNTDARVLAEKICPKLDGRKYLNDEEWKKYVELSAAERKRNMTCR